jgi:hypothetical protein
VRRGTQVRLAAIAELAIAVRVRDRALRHDAAVDACAIDIECVCGLTACAICLRTVHDTIAVVVRSVAYVLRAARSRIRVSASSVHLDTHTPIGIEVADRAGTCARDGIVPEWSASFVVRTAAARDDEEEERQDGARCLHDAMLIVSRPRALPICPARARPTG